MELGCSAVVAVDGDPVATVAAAIKAGLSPDDIANCMRSSARRRLFSREVPVVSGVRVCVRASACFRSCARGRGMLS